MSVPTFIHGVTGISWLIWVSAGCWFLWLMHAKYVFTLSLIWALMPGQYTHSMICSMHFSLPKCHLSIFCSTSLQSKLGTTMSVPFKTSPLTTDTLSWIKPKDWMLDGTSSLEGHSSFVYLISACSVDSLAVSFCRQILDIYLLLNVYKLPYLSQPFPSLYVQDTHKIKCVQQLCYNLVCSWVRSHNGCKANKNFWILGDFIRNFRNMCLSGLWSFSVTKWVPYINWWHFLQTNTRLKESLLIGQ